MQIGVIGISYKSSDVALREVVAKACELIFAENKWEMATIGGVLLSTCNRTEIYFSAAEMAEAHSFLLSLLKKRIHIPFEHRLYSLFCRQCFTHLAKVTSGLDSYILAETEIQNQVKKAYENAAENQLLPSSIHFLFQKCLKIGKEVRSHFPLMRGVSNLENIIYQMSLSLFKDFQDKKILFIGNSEINRKILAFFQAKQMHNITMCTRSPIAGEVKMVDRSVLFSWGEFDLLIFGTKEKEYLLNYENTKGIKGNRVVFDLSVPRNVDPQIQKHPDITLMNIDQLSELSEKKRRAQLLELQSSENVIRSLVDRQIGIYQTKRRVFSLVS